MGSTSNPTSPAMNVGTGTSDNQSTTEKTVDEGIDDSRTEMAGLSKPKLI